MKILAVANQKGGVAKSTLCVQLAHAAVEAGKRVLLVDLDPQGSLSVAYLANEEFQEEASTASALFAEGSVIVPEPIRPGLSIIRRDEMLRQLRSDNAEGLRRPGAYLRRLAAGYDLCIIDTPGALGENIPTTTAAMIAADAVVCPFAVGLFESEPLGQLLAYLNLVTSSGLNPKLRLLGLIPSRLNVKSAEEMEGLENLRKHPHVGKYVLPFVLGERASVKQAIYRRKPVWRGVRGNGHKTAAAEWLQATRFILTTLGVVK